MWSAQYLTVKFIGRLPFCLSSVNVTWNARLYGLHSVAEIQSALVRKLSIGASLHLHTFGEKLPLLALAVVVNWTKGTRPTTSSNRADKPRWRLLQSPPWKISPQVPSTARALFTEKAFSRLLKKCNETVVLSRQSIIQYFPGQIRTPVSLPLFFFMAYNWYLVIKADVGIYHCFAFFFICFVTIPHASCQILFLFLFNPFSAKLVNLICTHSSVMAATHYPERYLLVGVYTWRSIGDNCRMTG